MHSSKKIENSSKKTQETPYIPLSLAEYDYPLPDELIAQSPSEHRENSRLLVFHKNSGQKEDSHFKDILDKLPKNALIIANNSKVIPARILGNRDSGSKVEMLIMTPVPLLEQNALPYNDTEAEKDEQKKFCVKAQILLKGSKKIKVGEKLTFHTISAKILEKQDFGKHIVELSWKNQKNASQATGSLVAELEKYGLLPLPPYIKRPEGLSPNDLTRYQTVYADNSKCGSVAAPTAGLHFTKEIRESLINNGFSWEEITLHVGYGTFSPVRVENIEEHHMHAEYVEIPTKTANAICDAKINNRPIIAIGTTTTRSLEGMALAYKTFCENKINNNEQNNSCEFHIQNSLKHTPPNTSINKEILPRSGCLGFTDIFIYPSKKFHVIDGLLTNFHLPKSSLLMLVSAFAGYENTMKNYKHAIKEKYRFFSYGDAMLILN